MPPDLLVTAAKRRVSSHGFSALASMLAPALFFPLELLLAARLPQFQFLHHLSMFPWELYVIAIAGTLATLAGIADWRFHRSGKTAVGKPEHRAHVAALALGGVPLFVLMSIASIHPQPQRLLLPVLIIVIYTTLLIAYDEFVFHRRCGHFETLTHRGLTIGNGVAFIAWANWCFVRGAAHV